MIVCIPIVHLGNFNNLNVKFGCKCTGHIKLGM